MRYLKTFEMINDSAWEKMDKIQEDLIDFSHILEDEGFGIDIFAISDVVLNINIISREKYKVIHDSDTRIGKFNLKNFAVNLPDLTSVTEMPEIKEYINRVIGLLEDRNFKGACFIYLSKDKTQYSRYQLFHIIATHGKYMRRGKCQLYGSDLKVIESVKTEGTTVDERHTQNKIISEIECIRHILEDEKFKMNINTSSPNFIGISVIKNEFGPSYIDITGDQSVEEFDERLQEVCALNGYVCKKLNNTLISGYVVWHCWDSTKMDRSAFTYE